ncbi:MAG: hypothetical protein U0401_27990 [Anaerolineae bacterium]
MRSTSPTTPPTPRLLASPLRLLLLFLLWSLLLTYPLPLHLFSHIPRGSEEAATVPLFNLWTLRWNIDQLLQGYPHYWDAPIFAPDTGTFAFSEPQPLSALLAAPLWLAFQSPALGYNFVVILCLTLNGWFASGLLRSWGLPPLPAFLAGLLVQSLPFVAQEMGVLQLVALFGFLWSLFYLSRLLADLPGSSKLPGRWRSALGLALGPPMMFFTCDYYGLFSLIFLPLAALCHLRRTLHPQNRCFTVLAAVLALTLTAPLLWAQQERLAQYHFTRSAATIEANSAKLAYYGNFLDYNVLYAQLLGLKSGQGQRLFPGFGLLVLAILGLLDGGSKRVKLYCVGGVTGVAALAGAASGYGRLAAPINGCEIMCPALPNCAAPFVLRRWRSFIWLYWPALACAIWAAGLGSLQKRWNHRGTETQRKIKILRPLRLCASVVKLVADHVRL